MSKIDRTKPTPTADLVRLPNKGLASELIAALEAERERQGLTKTALAERMDVPNSRITEWTSGTYTPGLDVIENWLAALGVELQMLPPAGPDPDLDLESLTVPQLARIAAAHSRRAAKRELNDAAKVAMGGDPHVRASHLDQALALIESHPQKSEIDTLASALKKNYEKP